MFGQNQILKQEFKPTLEVVQIFKSLQNGAPAIFIRLYGCNLRCWYCDVDFESFKKTMTLDEILNELEIQKVAFPGPTPLVVITGGEPFRQDIVPLVGQLVKHFTVQIETSGTLWIPTFEQFDDDPDVQVIVSPKTGSIDTRIGERAEAWKYIITDESIGEDGLPIMSTQHKGAVNKLARPMNGAPVFIQPCDEQNDTVNDWNHKLCYGMAMKFGYQVSLQLNKILGVE